MSNQGATIWSKELPDDVRQKLREIVEIWNDRDHKLQVFFRADDIAIVDEQFTKLMHTFLLHKIPLCLAVVPEWLSQDRWKEMQQFERENPLWCWHQHGRSHTNYEKQGKKCEFGESRSREAIKKDLAEGREKLSTTMNTLFYPVFTPPWNRCSKTTLDLLQELDYKAISRSAGAQPLTKGDLPDIAINVDLHTRKEKSFSESWENLLAEFDQAANSGRMGIMLHHQLMNETSFAFIDILLSELKSCRNISCCTFRDFL